MFECALSKNQLTYDFYYKTFKAKFVRDLGLPLFSKDNFEKSVKMNLYSKSRAEKEKVELTDEIGGFYRVQHGYVPLFKAKKNQMWQQCYKVGKKK